LSRARHLTLAVLLAAGALAPAAYADSPCPAKCGKQCTARAKEGPQVSLEVRLVMAPKVVCRVAAAALGMAGKTEGALGALFLDEGQFFRLMQAVQEDRRTNVMQAPRLTVPDGACGGVCADGEVLFCGEGCPPCCQQGKPCDSGFRIAVRPSVSADRRFVRLALQAQVAGHEMADCDMLCVPDGGTVVLPGGRAECDVEVGCGADGALALLPYVGPLFALMRPEREPADVLLMVTPRVVCANEHARPPAAKAAPAPHAIKQAAVREIHKGKCSSAADSAAGEPGCYVVREIHKDKCSCDCCAESGCCAKAGCCAKSGCCKAETGAACCGTGACGKSKAAACASADPLVKELVSMMEETNSPEMFVVTVMVLGKVGPEARPAVPAILRKAERLGLFKGLINSEADPGGRRELTNAVFESIESILDKDGGVEAKSPIAPAGYYMPGPGFGPAPVVPSAFGPLPPPPGMMPNYMAPPPPAPPMPPRPSVRSTALEPAPVPPKPVP
jgi:hypothetical protein